MTLAEKLRFLADRVEDKKEFYLMYGEKKIPTYYKEFTESYDIQELEEIVLSLEPDWEFTEDEKTILRNLDGRWKWIARDESGDLCLYNTKPNKRENYWTIVDSYTTFNCFIHLFQSVKWSDAEPCKFWGFI